MNAISRRWRNVIIWVVLIAVVVAGVVFWRTRASAPLAAQYRTEPVSVGNVVKSVSANGTLNPVTLVNVGTQVSGTVKKLYADFNDHVQAGQILAELDQSLFKAQLQQDQANLASAQSNYRLALSNERRARDLFQKDYIAKSDLDQAVETTVAAKQAVDSAQAQIDRDQTNLSYTIIRSPVSGVVVSRNIDVGQTVAASFQTPTLFQIAEDLTHMQIDTSMAEADVGDIKVGQEARFTVDAFPNRTFTGVVHQIRLNPTIQQNVVTYNVVINVENLQKTLLPGMTAYVNVIEESRNDVLRVPNAALRFRPPTATSRNQAKPSTNGASAQRGQRVYRIEDNRLVAVPVKIGIADNQYTEIASDNLKAGDQVVVESLSGQSGGGEGSSRFRFRVF